MYTGAGIIKIYAGSTGRPFAEKMCAYLGTQLGDAETIKFSEGNIFVRINESIRDKDVYLVQPIGRQPNDEFVEMLFWIDAFKRASANSVTVIAPYGQATMQLLQPMQRRWSTHQTSLSR